MRETVKSLRAYFIVAGVLSLLSSLSVLGQERDPILLALVLSSLALSVLFVVAGIRLPVWLRTRLPLIQGMVGGTIGLQILETMYLVGILHAAAEAVAWRPVLVLIIGWYLIHNAKRLAADSRHEAELERSQTN